jgi:hypothetical protein
MKQARTFFLGDGDDKSICGCRNSQTMSKENAPSISVVAPYGKSVHVSFWENREKKAFDFHSLSLFLHLCLSLSLSLSLIFPVVLTSSLLFTKIFLYRRLSI